MISAGIKLPVPVITDLIMQRVEPQLYLKEGMMLQYITKCIPWLKLCNLIRNFSMWVIFSLLAAISAACAIVLSKAGLKKVDANLAFAVQAVLILSVSWGVVLFQKKATEIGKIEQVSWIYLVCAGVLTCLSSLFSFNALKLGDAALVSSIERLSLVFAIILAVVFLKEQLNWKIIVGALLMIGGAVMITLSRGSE
jgi:bacterial/archaeal transporter family protein